MNRKRSASLIAVLLAVSLAGCAARPLHPGAANTFDSSSYDAVLVAHSVIESTKADLANNAFPASIAGQVKTALNDLIKGYNVADASYQTYHQAALAGTATAAQSSAVSSALTDLQTKSAALTAAKAAQ